MAPVRVLAAWRVMGSAYSSTSWKRPDPKQLIELVIKPGGVECRSAATHEDIASSL